MDKWTLVVIAIALVLLAGWVDRIDARVDAIAVRLAELEQEVTDQLDAIEVRVLVLENEKEWWEVK